MESVGWTGYLGEGRVSCGQDDDHGDIVATVRQLQDLYLVILETGVLELGFLEHHGDAAGSALADGEVSLVDVVFVKLTLPLPL